MATNSAGSKSLNYYTQQIPYLMARISYADGASNVYTLGTVPANSLIIKPMSGVHVRTAYNAGTNNLINIGTSADDDLFGTVMSLTTATFVPLDEAIGGFYVTSDTIVTASHALSGTAATAGDGVVIIAYAPLNPGE
jgi:hypothetical protein